LKKIKAMANEKSLTKSTKDQIVVKF
jgi:hypothetical protein